MSRVGSLHYFLVMIECKPGFVYESFSPIAPICFFCDTISVKHDYTDPIKVGYVVLTGGKGVPKERDVEEVEILGPTSSKQRRARGRHGSMEKTRQFLFN